MTTQQNTLTATIKELIHQNQIQHIAIIMDGNRRWAEQNGLPKTTGHNKGRKAFKSIVKYSSLMGVKYLTTYAFSTENWGRDTNEVAFLMDLFVESLKSEIKELCENNIQLKFIGRRDRLNPKIVKMMEDSEASTAENTGLVLQVAIDYGARYEIVAAIRDIARQVKEGSISLDEIDVNLVDSKLYTKGIPDPDLIIRTGGEKRLSNYLLWQAAYSELYITNTFWPEFKEDEFDKAILEFSKRQRRWGKD
jgi:undecaprenyl diphosphate synthase